MSRFQKVTPRLPVASLSHTIAFYMSLGFRVGSLWPDENPTFTILDKDDLSIQFYTPPEGSPEAIGHATLNFDVSDVQGLHLALKDKIAIDWGPEVYSYGRREFAVRDPDGHCLIFTEETSDPPTCQEG